MDCIHEGSDRCYVQGPWGGQISESAVRAGVLELLSFISDRRARRTYRIVTPRISYARSSIESSESPCISQHHFATHSLLPPMNWLLMHACVLAGALQFQLAHHPCKSCFITCAIPDVIYTTNHGQTLNLLRLQCHSGESVRFISGLTSSSKSMWLEWHMASTA